MNRDFYVKNKSILMESVKGDVYKLKELYNHDGSDKEAIIAICEKAARAVINCGDFCFDLDRNATSFLETNFGSDAINIMMGLPPSSAMQDFLRNNYESWHWHGW